MFLSPAGLGLPPEQVVDVFFELFPVVIMHLVLYMFAEGMKE